MATLINEVVEYLATSTAHGEPSEHYLLIDEDFLDELYDELDLIPDARKSKLQHLDTIFGVVVVAVEKVAANLRYACVYRVHVHPRDLSIWHI